jgi:tRNA (guanine-N7-)-methyltransferase
MLIIMTQEKRIIQLDAASLRYFAWDLYKFSSIEKNHLEIGFGNGQYIIEMAEKRSKESFFGVELSRKYFDKTLGKAQRFSLKNIKLFWSDARSCLTIFPDDFFNIVHINFPDPWPKKRHNVRRVADNFLALEIKRVLKNGGAVFLATDYQEYFIKIIEIFEKNGFSVLYRGNSPNIERISKTKYETVFISTGIEIFYGVLKKI